MRVSFFFRLSVFMSLSGILLIFFGCDGPSSQLKSITYQGSPFIFPAGYEIAPLIPDITGIATEFRVNEALPAGLKIDNYTGLISGTPSAEQPSCTYTVTASHNGISVETLIQIEVREKLDPPADFHYSGTPFTFVAGYTVFPRVPSYIGKADKFTITPPLPDGLTLNPETGWISGLPSISQPWTEYLVTASNKAGSMKAAITLTVEDRWKKPTTLRYPGTPYILWVGEKILEITPSIDHAAENYYVTPQLPPGLVIHPDTGVFSGTPEASTETASYIITAVNPKGSASASIQITINAAPSGLGYSSDNSFILLRGRVMDNLFPAVSGIVERYAVLPELPAGVSLDPVTGVISGKPVNVQPQTSYIVTASNPAGATSVEVKITIL